MSIVYLQKIVTTLLVLINFTFQDDDNQFQECQTQEQKNEKLMEILLIRGGSVVTKFCDALQLSGHNFLADSLREERKYHN